MLGGKGIATFFLGALAGYATYKYVNMSDEEKEKLVNDIKAKANNLMDQAENADVKIAEYFNELKAKGSDVLKEHWPQVEAFFNDLFKAAEEPAAATEA